MPYAPRWLQSALQISTAPLGAKSRVKIGVIVPEEITALVVRTIESAARQ
jgi:hypothetical protein